LSSVVTGLVPQLVWDQFARISAIPRPSRKEKRVAEYVLELAKETGLETDRDAAGNVVVRKPASVGKEKSSMVVLQSHLDMVCEKNRDTVHDFEGDGIRLVRSNGYIQADGTTLGADNGIGVAAALGVMLDTSLVHGPLEILFTVDEEVGFTGVQGLRTDFFKGRILLNLDSEEEGTLYIGCAGGGDTMLTIPVEWEPAPKGYVPLSMTLTGLRGGHSGADIDDRRGNAIKLLVRSLLTIAKSNDISICAIEGGGRLNAIPREAEAILYLRGERLKPFRDRIDELNALFGNEYSGVETGLLLQVAKPKLSLDGRVFSKKHQETLLNLLQALPHGVIAMSADIPGLVETSTNVASVQTGAEAVVVGTNQRSAVKSALEDIVATIGALGRLAGARVAHANGYPGWKPNLQSVALNVVKETYVQLFGKEPEAKVIHAGLECGLIAEKFPGIDMVSFGPTIERAHSPEERVDIVSVRKFWELLVGVLENLS
jgi:dipeptidase D